MQGIGKMTVVASALAVVASVGACDSTPTVPAEITLEDVFGSYAAVVLTATTNDTARDELARGTTFEITLHPDGTTSGRLFVPNSNMDADLAGTFSFDESSDQVVFEQDADTFVRDMTFTAAWSDGAVHLEGEESFGATSIFVVLK